MGPPGRLQATLGAAGPLAPSVSGVHVHPRHAASRASHGRLGSWGRTARDPKPRSFRSRVPRPHGARLGRF